MELSFIFSQRNQLSLRKQAFLDKFGWKKDNLFYFYGIPIDLSKMSDQAKKQFFYLVALCLIETAGASNEEICMTNPAGNITYLYKIFKDTLDDYDQGSTVIKNLEKVPSKCGALILQACNELFNLFYTSKATFTVASGEDTYQETVNSASLSRAGSIVDYAFEDCMENEMDDAGDLLNLTPTELGLILGLSLGLPIFCACAGFAIWYFCCRKPEPDQMPLIEKATPKTPSVQH